MRRARARRVAEAHAFVEANPEAASEIGREVASDIASLLHSHESIPAAGHVILLRKDKAWRVREYRLASAVYVGPEGEVKSDALIGFGQTPPVVLEAVTRNGVLKALDNTYLGRDFVRRMPIAHDYRDLATQFISGELGRALVTSGVTHLKSAVESSERVAVAHKAPVHSIALV